MDPDDRMLWERTFKKWDGFEHSMKDLCNRTTRIEEALTTHLSDQEKRASRKEKVFYGIIAVIGVTFGIFQYVN